MPAVQETIDQVRLIDVDQYKYGFETEAREMAEKTIRLFGQDFEQNNTLHEYYNPDTGEPIMNKGFQNWNYLVMNMLAWEEKRAVVEEF